MTSPAPTDPNEIFRQIAEAGKGIRFGRGVVGKTGHGLYLLFALWGGLVWKMSANLVLDAVLFSVGLVATAVFIWFTRSTQGYAERNPAQALMEGAEITEYKKFEATSKGQPTSIAGPMVELGENVPVTPLPPRPDEPNG